MTLLTWFSEELFTNQDGTSANAIEGRPVRVSLSVNGQPSGHADASSGWSDLGFAISETSLEPGFNMFRFTYYPTPRDLDADHEGANAAVAVAEVRVESAKP